jgi:lysozyme
MSFTDILRAQLRSDEGYRKFPYVDSVGKITIGVGHNLSAKGVTDAQVSQWLDDDIADAIAAARELLPEDFDQLSDVRKAVICNMAFQLGGAGLAEFQNTLRNIRDGRWDDAATAMLQSKWAQQVPARARRLANQMRTDFA